MLLINPLYRGFTAICKQVVHSSVKKIAEATLPSDEKEGGRKWTIWTYLPAVLTGALAIAATIGALFIASTAVTFISATAVALISGYGSICLYHYAPLCKKKEFLKAFEIAKKEFEKSKNMQRHSREMSSTLHKGFGKNIEEEGKSLNKVQKLEKELDEHKKALQEVLSSIQDGTTQIDQMIIPIHQNSLTNYKNENNDIKNSIEKINKSTTFEIDNIKKTITRYIYLINAFYIALNNARQEREAKDLNLLQTASIATNGQQNCLREIQKKGTLLIQDSKELTTKQKRLSSNISETEEITKELNEKIKQFKIEKERFNKEKQQFEEKVKQFNIDKQQFEEKKSSSPSKKESKQGFMGKIKLIK